MRKRVPHVSRFFETWADAKEMHIGKSLLPIEQLHTKSTDNED
jgi:hypothetical protein